MGMEKDTSRFFTKIAQSISAILLWMLLNIFWGMYKGYAFFDGTPGWPNYIYYILSLCCLLGLIYYLKNKWK